MKVTSLECLRTGFGVLPEGLRAGMLCFLLGERLGDPFGSAAVLSTAAAASADPSDSAASLSDRLGAANGPVSSPEASSRSSSMSASDILVGSEVVSGSASFKADETSDRSSPARGPATSFSKEVDVVAPADFSTAGKHRKQCFRPVVCCELGSYS